MFTFNNRNFSKDFAFPPIDEEIVQNALMVAPYNDEGEESLWIYGWGCDVRLVDEAEIWGWEPLCPYSAKAWKEEMVDLKEITNLP